MEPDNDCLSDIRSSDCDEILILKKKLTENEDKLVKFKKFVITLKNERTQLQQKATESESEIDKLKSELGKFQNKSYQQIFQNFQNLQNEYDKTQDEVEVLKKSNKSLESDLLKCGQDLSHSRDTCALQQEENDRFKVYSTQQQLQISSLIDSNKEFESKIIVLQSEYEEEKKKKEVFQNCEAEKIAFEEELHKKCDQLSETSKKFEQSLQRIIVLENEIEKKDTELQQYAVLEEEKQLLTEDNQKHQVILASQNDQIDQFNQTLKDKINENEQLQKNLTALQLNFSQTVSELEMTISDLKNKLKLNEEDLSHEKTKFNDYKQRVSNVLKESNINNSQHNKNVESLNYKIDSLQDECNTLRDQYSKAIVDLEKITAEKVDLNDKVSTYESQLKNHDEMKSKLQLLSNENFKLLSIIDQSKATFAKERQFLTEENSANIENIRLKYENKIKELEDEIHSYRNASDDSNSIVNSNTSFEEIKDENLSFQSNNSNFEKNFLEEILNLDSNSKSSDDIPQSSNIDNLTQLLSESENNITLLSEQNRLLKDEIRRLQRSIDRTDIANNLEYLKNVLLKFLTIKGVDERERLITVLTTVLKLTSEERDVFHQCIQDSYNPQANSKWSLWQW